MTESLEQEPSELIQPIILRIDKEDPSSEAEGIAAVALASVAAFLSAPENPDWRVWAAGAFGKTVRRANPKMFTKVLTQHPEHMLVEVGKAQAAGLPPLPADHLPKLIAKLQVSGTQLPFEGQSVEGAVTIVLNKALKMSTGKSAAQAAHALFAWLIEAEHEFVENWIEAGTPIGVQQMSANEFRKSMQSASGPVIQDAGRTEIEPGSSTAYVRVSGTP